MCSSRVFCFGSSRHPRCTGRAQLRVPKHVLLGSSGSWRSRRTLLAALELEVDVAAWSRRVAGVACPRSRAVLEPATLIRSRHVRDRLLVLLQRAQGGVPLFALARCLPASIATRARKRLLARLHRLPRLVWLIGWDRRGFREARVVAEERENGRVKLFRIELQLRHGARRFPCHLPWPGPRPSSCFSQAALEASARAARARRSRGRRHHLHYRYSARQFDAAGARLHRCSVDKHRTRVRGLGGSLFVGMADSMVWSCSLPGTSSCTTGILHGLYRARGWSSLSRVFEALLDGVCGFPVSGRTWVMQFF